MSNTDASQATAEEWPDQPEFHPFDGEPARPAGVLDWMAARAANSRQAAANEWAEVQALSAGPQTPETGERIRIATFHAQRHEHNAAQYEGAWNGGEVA